VPSGNLDSLAQNVGGLNAYIEVIIYGLNL
jgi:hypothetical protein